MSGAAIETAAAPDGAAALHEAIRHRVETAGTSFYWAMRLLPRDRREAMYALYAWCREVDDIADSDRPVASKLAALAGCRDEIEALYAGHPRQLITLALHEPTRRFALRREDFVAVIDGMEMDAREDIRAPDFATLDLYCARVASAVGHLAVHVFGDPSPAAHQLADALGRALQLTNILRDLAEDAQRGRLYLPREILGRHGIGGTEPVRVLGHPALPAVCREVAAIAERHFDEAEQAMARCRHRAMRPAAVMGAVYRAMLRELKRREWRDPSARLVLPRGLKLWLALRHGLL